MHAKFFTNVANLLYVNMNTILHENIYVIKSVHCDKVFYAEFSHNGKENLMICDILR